MSAFDPRRPARRMGAPEALMIFAALLGAAMALSALAVHVLR